MEALYEIHSIMETSNMDVQSVTPPQSVLAEDNINAGDMSKKTPMMPPEPMDKGAGPGKGGDQSKYDGHLSSGEMPLPELSLIHI